MSNPPPIPDAQRAKVWLESDGARYATDVYVYNLVKALAADCERLQQENARLKAVGNQNAYVGVHENQRANELVAQLTASQQEVTRLTATLTTLRDEMRMIALISGQCSVEGIDNLACRMAAAESSRATKWADTLTHLLTGETRT